VRTSLTLLCAAVICAGAVARSAAVDPAALVLRLSDLPIGFLQVSDSGTVSNAGAADGGGPALLARLSRWGRTVGYESHFIRVRPQRGIPEGPVEIRSLASVYRTATGAAASFAYARRFLVPTSFSPLALGFTIGDAARQYVGGGLSGESLVYILIWRKGRVNASLVLSGRLGELSAGDVAPLARAQQARIVAELGHGGRG